MHYMTLISPWMQKHRFKEMGPSALFVQSIPVLPEHEKWHVNLLRPRRTRMHYVTRRSHLMQKHKFGTTCLHALFLESVSVSREHEK
jgi:hypothetical protein